MSNIVENVELETISEAPMGEFTIIESLMGVVPFLIWFGLAIVMLVAFVKIYLWVTPYHEIDLIKDKNESAAISLGGAMIGFTLPLTSAMDGSANLVDFGMWGVIAIIAQVLTFSLVRIVFPRTQERIENNERGMAIFLAATSITVGMLNASSMSY